MAQRTRRKFTPEFRSEIVRLVLDGRYSVAEVCSQHELNESSVYQWVRQKKADRGDPSAGLTSDERAELAALRKENKELRREKDFLEEAAAYFAKAKKRGSL